MKDESNSPGYDEKLVLKIIKDIIPRFKEGEIDPIKMRAAESKVIGMTELQLAEKLIEDYQEGLPENKYYYIAASNLYMKLKTERVMGSF